MRKTQRPSSMGKCIQRLTVCHLSQAPPPSLRGWWQLASHLPGVECVTETTVSAPPHHHLQKKQMKTLGTAEHRSSVRMGPSICSETQATPLCPCWLAGSPAGRQPGVGVASGTPDGGTIHPWGLGQSAAPWLGSACVWRVKGSPHKHPYCTRNAGALWPREGFLSPKQWNLSNNQCNVE